MNGKNKIYKVSNDFKITNKVAIDNELIFSLPRLKSNQIKLLDLCVSAVNTDKANEFPEVVELSKEDILNAFGFKGEKRAYYLEELFNDFMELRLKLEVNNNRKRLRSAIREVEWGDNDDDLVTIEFDEVFMPKIFGLNEVFTQYRISETLRLKGKYSVILFRCLIAKYNKGKSYHNLKEINPEFSLKELRELTHTQNQYKKNTDFIKYVIDNSIKEINEKTSIKVNYEEIRGAHNRIVKIHFFIKDNKVDYDEFLKLINEEDFDLYEVVLNEYKVNDIKLSKNDVLLLEMFCDMYNADNVLNVIKNASLGKYLHDLRRINKDLKKGEYTEIDSFL